MSPRSRRVTDTELSILEVLWSRGPTRVRDIAEALYGDASASRNATVQSLLERLERKALVERDRAGHAHTWSAREARDTVIGQELQEVADKVAGGSLTPLLLTLAERVQLSDEERAELMRIIDEAVPPDADGGGEETR